MSDTTTTAGIQAGAIVRRDDLGEGDVGTWAYWDSQERLVDKESRTWAKTGRRIMARYRDEREGQGAGRDDPIGRVHRFNILWSNVQTLQPTLYARTPKPEVQRRFLDADETGRLASILLERSISYSLDPAGGSPFDAMMQAVVLDRLLPGRGTARVLYVPVFGDELPEEEFAEADDEASEVSGAGDHPEPRREVVDEQVTVRYVYWEDYAEGPARTWEEVPWVRYRSYMTRDELVKRFGKKGRKVNLDYPKAGGREMRAEKGDPPPDLYKKARVHEYWDRAKMQVTWIAPGTPDLVLDEMDDPLGLVDFFPSPDPLLATMTTDKRIPVPDYVEYRDQAIELDNLTARIDILTQALKVAGVYPGEQKQMLQQLITGPENVLIPVLDWQAFADKGGLKEFIQFVPIQQVASTLLSLYDARDRTKAILYEVTGIGDILRGETVPNETATAQQLKSNFATRRIVPQQRAVARFARDMIRLMGGVIAEHFSAETISRITGYPQLAPVPQVPPPPAQWIPDPRAMQSAANDGMQGAPMGGAPMMQGVA